VSLDLHDIGNVKVDDFTWQFIGAKADATGICRNEIVRDWLRERAIKEHDEHIRLERILKSKRLNSEQKGNAE
jgi:hypothetical protein